MKCYCVHAAYQVAEEKLADLERQSGVLRDKAEFLHQAVADRCMQRDWRIGTKGWANLCPHTLVKKLKKQCFLMSGVQVMASVKSSCCVGAEFVFFALCWNVGIERGICSYEVHVHIHNHFKCKGTSLGENNKLSCAHVPVVGYEDDKNWG